MKTLASFIKNKTPKFSKFMVEGFVYHRLNDAVSYLDNFIRYSCESKTSTHLKYLGYKELTPKEELKYLFNKTTKMPHDIAENDMYLVKFLFQYGEEPEPREYYFYVPFASKGNVIRLSGNRFLVMPTLADKVISIGERVIFINILTAKYNFDRMYHPIAVNNVYCSIPVINSELYKNQSKKQPDTTKANSTIMHYLLANYGYTKTMEMLLGFVPKPVYDHAPEGFTILESSKNPPKGYIQDKELYEPTHIKFAVPNEQYNSTVGYCIGNLFYIIDNFPDRITVDNLDEITMWRRLMGEIIHSGNYGLPYLYNKMYAHFNDLNSQFDTVTVNKLKDVKVNANNLMELLVVIFQNFNDWIMSEETRSLYYNKSYEVESFVLSTLTSRITRIVLDINKEELRYSGAPLEKNVVDKIFKKYFATRAIFSLKKEKTYVTSIEYSGDHLYFKNTSMVSRQESDSVNVKKADTNTSERGKLVASAATIGSILGLSKKNPTPLIRMNPYVNVDYLTGTVLPHPEYNDIVTRTDLLLANVEVNEDIVDIDEVVSDFDENEEIDDIEYEAGENWSED